MVEAVLGRNFFGGNKLLCKKYAAIQKYFADNQLMPSAEMLSGRFVEEIIAIYG